MPRGHQWKRGSAAPTADGPVRSHGVTTGPMTPVTLVRVVESSLQAVRCGKRGRNGNDVNEKPMLLVVVVTRSDRQPLRLLKRANVTTETVRAVYEGHARKALLRTAEVGARRAHGA